MKLMCETKESMVKIIQMISVKYHSYTTFFVQISSDPLEVEYNHINLLQMKTINSRKDYTVNE